MINGHRQSQQIIWNWEERQEAHKQEVKCFEDVHRMNNILTLGLKK
jgi:hypothetical protein